MSYAIKVLEDALRTREAYISEHESEIAGCETRISESRTKILRLMSEAEELRGCINQQQGKPA